MSLCLALHVQGSLAERILNWEGSQAPEDRLYNLKGIVGGLEIKLLFHVFFAHIVGGVCVGGGGGGFIACSLSPK